MTEGRCTAFMFSFVLHGIIVAALLITPFFGIRNEAPITVNLSFVTPDRNGPSGTGARPKGEARPGKKEGPSRSGKQDIVRDREAAGREELKAVNAENHIITGPHRLEGHPGDPAAAHRGVSPASSGGGPGGSKTLNYSQPGGADERHFSFIRDTIIQGIVYPERARRMGWEGRVVLSFSVRENGSVGDVKVVASSGFPVLDESAREAIARTSFRKKVPVRLYVLLPVEYRLQLR